MQRVDETMAGNERAATVGYALIDRSGYLRCSSATFQRWLGERTIASLLPGITISVDRPRQVERTQLHLSEQETVDADVELTQLGGADELLVLLRVQIAAGRDASYEYRDVVTGLPDRRALTEHRARWQRDAGWAVPHAVLFLDLDNYKRVNDAWGHAIGDRVLAILAERWRQSLRSGDLIVRYGGDEFVALVAGVQSHEAAEPIVDRLRRATAVPLEVAGHRLEITATIGVALAGDGTASLDELIAAADKAMYVAKRRTG